MSETAWWDYDYSLWRYAAHEALSEERQQISFQTDHDILKYLIVIKELWEQ